MAPGEGQLDLGSVVRRTCIGLSGLWFLPCKFWLRLWFLSRESWLLRDRSTKVLPHEPATYRTYSATVQVPQLPLVPCPEPSRDPHAASKTRRSHPMTKPPRVAQAQDLPTYPDRPVCSIPCHVQAFEVQPCFTPVADQSPDFSSRHSKAGKAPRRAGKCGAHLRSSSPCFLGILLQSV